MNLWRVMVSSPVSTLNNIKGVSLTDKSVSSTNLHTKRTGKINVR